MVGGGLAAVTVSLAISILVATEEYDPPISARLPVALVKLANCTGSGPLRVVQIGIPKTGTRHLRDHLTLQYDAEREAEKDSSECRSVWSLHILGPSIVRLVHGSGPDFEPPACDSLRHELFVQTTELWSTAFAGLGEGVRTLSLVRDPVEHTLSVFSQLQGFRAMEGGWEKALRRFVSSEYMTNFQTAFLAGRRFQYAKMWAEGRSSIRDQELCTSDSLVATRADLDALLAMIDGGALLLGTVEEFEASVRWMASELQWKQQLPESGRRVANVPKSRGKMSHEPSLTARPWDETADRLRQDQVPHDIIEMIREHTGLDRELYNVVASQFPVKTEL